MEIEIIINLAALMGITALSNTIGTLKTIFVAKKYAKPVYITTFIDALVYGTVMKQVSSGEGFYFILAFALGKLIGAWIGDSIENKIALGIIEVEIYQNSLEKTILIADELRSLGYSVETSTTFGYKGKKRYKTNVVILRKEYIVLENILKKHDYINPTLKIRDINNITGKFSISSN